MSNALNPTAMTVAERLDEVAEILAAGLIRLRGPKSSPLSADSEKVRSTVPPTRAVMPTSSTTESSDDRHGAGAAGGAEDDADRRS